MKLHRYNTFINEGLETSSHRLPTYEECVEMCAKEDAAFYESKFSLEGYNVSVFNYRIAQYKDFETPIESKPEVRGFEMRGLTFVFNEDGSLFKRFLLLEKFFNLNQVANSMYSVVKNYKIKYVNNKEDGSIASFIKLPNGKVLGKSKMGFDNDQANGINKLYLTDKDVSAFVNWTLDNDIVAIFEYVSPHNRIVLRYPKEELILLRLRDNKTGKHLDIRDHLDKLGTIKIAPFMDDFKDLDSLIELTATQVDKEGSVVQAVDEYGRDVFFKIKTPWYMERHGLLTNDLYREHILIGYILDDKIDDILAQIPEEEVEAHERINKMISVIRRSITEKVNEIEKLYNVFIQMSKDRKAFAARYIKDPNFGFVMALDKGDRLRAMTKEEILEYYGTMEDYEAALKRIDKFELVKTWIRDNNKRLNLSREWLKKKDPSIFFQEPDETKDDN